MGDSSRRKLGSKAIRYDWRKKYAGMTPSEMKRRQLKEENGG